MDPGELAALRDGLARDGVRYLFGWYVDVHGGYDLETTMPADAFLEPMAGCINELGDAVHQSFTELKRAEWLACNTIVGQWEKDTYLQLWWPPRAVAA